MNDKMKVWTKEDVELFLQNIDHEAAKKDTFVFGYYLDENDEYDEVELAVFIVLEWVQGDKEYNIKGSTVRGTKRMGWLNDAYDARKSREEYGDVGDHCLISEDEAQKHLADMGLELEDAKSFLIDSFMETNGYPPVMLPEDPRFETRRDAAKARLGLEPQS